MANRPVSVLMAIVRGVKSVTVNLARHTSIGFVGTA
jgi:hypothetical protein